MTAIVLASRSLKSIAEALKHNRRTAALWRTAVTLSRLTFTEALLLRIAYVVSLAMLLFYEIIDFLLKLRDWSST